MFLASVSVVASGLAWPDHFPIFGDQIAISVTTHIYGGREGLPVAESKISVANANSENVKADEAS